MLTVLLLTQKTIWEIPVTTVYTQIEPAIADICIYILKKELHTVDPEQCRFELLGPTKMWIFSRGNTTKGTT